MAKAAALATFIALGISGGAAAQTIVSPGGIEVNPVDCWWRTSTPSVRVGEPFTIDLTCAALETEAATAVIDRSRLGTASMQLPPFEVTGGTQSADHVTAGRRFMQYHYNVRLLTEDAFGSDVVIPVLPITYRIESRVQQDSAVAGREQTYELPALVMRISSLVPSGAGHIRETAVPSLDEIAAREFRARMLRLVAIILFAIAGLTLALAVVRWFRQTRKADLDAARHFLPPRVVIAGVRRELEAIQRQTRAGWDHDALARALGASRVVASYLSGHTVAQREVETTTGGELLFPVGWFGRRRIAVSGAATALLLRGRAGDEEVAEALATLTAARYGRADAYDSTTLDEALAAIIRGARRVASDHTWRADMMRSAHHARREWTPRAWAR